MAEGPTDYRFLKPIVLNTLLNIAFNEVNTELEIQVYDIKYSKNGKFEDYVYNASKSGYKQFGIMYLFVHADADSLKPDSTYSNKINPAVQFLKKHQEEDLCREIVPIVPVYETESWMLADKDLLKKLIGTKKSDEQLRIEGHPESMSRPKEKIEEAILIGKQDFPTKVRRSISISDFYGILGEAISIEKLSNYQSFRDFENNIRKALSRMNLICLV